MKKKVIDIAEVKKTVLALLENQRQKILITYPFIGGIMMRLDLIPIRDNRITTACTDGNNIFVDCEFCSTLSEDELKFVLAHELFHVVYLHLVRLQNRDPKLFNIATDMEINSMLKNEGFKVLDDCYLTPPELEGLNAEGIYDALLEKQSKQKSKSNSNNNSNPQDGESQGGESQDGETESGPKSKGSQQFDKHIYSNKPLKDSTGKKRTDKWGEVGEDPNLTNTRVPTDISDKVREAVVSAVQKTERVQGKVPSYMKQFINEICTPQVNWREELSQFITQSYSGEYSWNRFSRRHIYQGLYLPGRLTSSLNIALMLDTSGSCVQDFPTFYAELKSLVQSFGRYEITIIQVDAAVTSVKTYSDMGDELPNIKDFVFTGGGGSNMIPAFDYLNKNPINYDAIVCLTDGYIDFPKEPVNKPTICIISNGGTTNFCSWAKMLNLT